MIQPKAGDLVCDSGGERQSGGDASTCPMSGSSAVRQQGRQVLRDSAQTVAVDDAYTARQCRYRSRLDSSTGYFATTTRQCDPPRCLLLPWPPLPSRWRTSVRRSRRAISMGRFVYDMVPNKGKLMTWLLWLGLVLCLLAVAAVGLPAYGSTARAEAPRIAAAVAGMPGLTPVPLRTAPARP